jgi:hypothetical protein
MNIFLGKFGLIKLLVLFGKNSMNTLSQIIQLIRKYLKETWK